MSGCTNNAGVNGSDDNSVEFSDYKVTTKWGSYWTGFTVKDGFYHEIPSQQPTYPAYYYINGKVKNIGNKPIDAISITAKFFDVKKNYLDSSSILVFHLYLNETQNFTITADNDGAVCGPDYCQYFEYVDHYTIEYSITYH